LEAYNDIELSEDEYMEALIWAKSKKKDRLKQENLARIQEENRKKLFNVRTNVEKLDEFLIKRAKKIFGVDENDYPLFVIDENNRGVYNMLLMYFCEDVRFEAMAITAGVKNPSLKKGILLCGNFGVGKTDIMALYAVNFRQVFEIKNAKAIANEYEKAGEDATPAYLTKKKNAFQDPAVLYQEFSGLCIDDIGTEDVKVHYGNKKSVIADLIELRYEKNLSGSLLHGTTNLTAEQIKDYYGGRIASRLREIFNFIELPGNDRRI
jgi:hypothetical protein